MNSTNCPFDGDFCEKKQARLDEWRERCLRNPQPYYTNMSCQDMFAGCPIKHDQERNDACERFRRYIFIVNKVMSGVDDAVKKALKQDAQR